MSFSKQTELATILIVMPLFVFFAGTTNAKDLAFLPNDTLTPAQNDAISRAVKFYETGKYEYSMKAASLLTIASANPTAEEQARDLVYELEKAFIRFISSKRMGTQQSELELDKASKLIINSDLSPNDIYRSKFFLSNIFIKLLNPFHDREKLEFISVLHPETWPVEAQLKLLPLVFYVGDWRLCHSLYKSIFNPESKNVLPPDANLLGNYQRAILCNIDAGEFDIAKSLIERGAKDLENRSDLKGVKILEDLSLNILFEQGKLDELRKSLEEKYKSSEDLQIKSGWAKFLAKVELYSFDFPNARKYMDFYFQNVTDNPLIRTIINDSLYSEILLLGPDPARGRSVAKNAASQLKGIKNRDLTYVHSPLLLDLYFLSSSTVLGQDSLKLRVQRKRIAELLQDDKDNPQYGQSVAEIDRVDSGEQRLLSTTSLKFTGLSPIPVFNKIIETLNPGSVSSAGERDE